MAGFPKAGAAAQALFDELFPDAPDVVRRPMFGHAAAFVNGNMFMGTFGDDVLLRLAENDRDTLLARKDTRTFEPMEGRPMREYVIVPRAWRDDIDAARPWVERSLAFGRSLVPKAKKKPSSRRR